MFLLPTFIICQGGGEASYCYISFIQKTILLLPHVYVYKKTFYKEISEFFLFIWYALNCAQWCCFLDTFSIKWNWEKVVCRSRHILLFATWLFIKLPRRVGWCHKVEATIDILNILIICYWLNFDTQDSMICLSNYLLRLCLTPSLVIFFWWATTFLSQRLLVTRHRSLQKVCPTLFTWV